MSVDARRGFNESLCDDLRQLIARKKELRSWRGSPIRRLLASVRVAMKRVQGLVGRRSRFFLAIGLGLLLAGLSLLVIQDPHIESSISPGVAASNQMVPHLGRPQSTALGNDQNNAGTNEAFIIRVGSFRNPTNARRVAESLKQKSLDVRTDVSAAGLHVLTLGPFSRKGAAEAAASSVKETVGLSPQVLQHSFQ